MLQPKYNNKNNAIFTGFDSIEINLVFQYLVLRFYKKSNTILLGWCTHTCSTGLDRALADHGKDGNFLDT